MTTNMASLLKIKNILNQCQTLNDHQSKKEILNENLLIEKEFRNDKILIFKKLINRLFYQFGINEVIIQTAYNLGDKYLRVINNDNNELISFIEPKDLEINLILISLRGHRLGYDDYKITKENLKDIKW